MLILTLVLIMSQMRSEICSISSLRNTRGGIFCVQVVSHLVEKYAVVLWTCEHKMGPTLFGHTVSLPESPAGTWTLYCPKGPQNIVVSIGFNSS